MKPFAIVRRTSDNGIFPFSVVSQNFNGIRGKYDPESGMAYFRPHSMVLEMYDTEQEMLNALHFIARQGVEIVIDAAVPAGAEEPVATQVEVEVVASQVEDSISDAVFARQQVLRKLLAREEDYAWLKEMEAGGRFYALNGNLSTHVNNMAKKDEKAGKVVRIRENGNRIYKYKLEAFKLYCLSYRQYIITKLGA